MRELIKAAEEARKGAESETFLRDDYEIHAFLVHMVHNSLLQNAAHRLLQHNLRFWRSYWSTARRSTPACCRTLHCSPLSRRVTPRPPRRRCANTSGRPSSCCSRRSRAVRIVRVLDAAEYDGAFNADWTYPGNFGTFVDRSVWPAGSAYPDYFMIGDPHTNFYEGKATIDDIKLFVPAP